MIVVATEDFEVYHDVVGELRTREATFTTVQPTGGFPPDTAVIITGPDDDVQSAVTDRDWEREPDILRASPDRVTRVVDAALLRLRSDTTDSTEGAGRVVVGVDPGKCPGIAVLLDDTIVAAHQVPRSDVAAVVEKAVAGASDPLVRVGDGARRHSSRLIDAIDTAPVELVDETGTTPTLGPGAGGTGDILAAVNIARRDGDRIHSRQIDPTAGEVQQIKDRAREQSATNRAIDDALARQVARGTLTIEEALEKHAEQ